MKKIKMEKPKISLRLFITMIVILMSGVILWVYSFASGRMYYSKHKKALVESISIQCDMLSYNLRNNEFSIDEPVDLNIDIEAVATFFYGRVMIINSDYRIIKDSYADNQNSFIISDEVIRVMTGEAEVLIKEENGYIQYICPVKSDDSIMGVILVNASTDSFNAISDSVAAKNAVSCMIIMLFCIIAANIIGIASVRGIKFINRQMKIAKDGHLDEQIPVKGFKEFRALIQNYNDTISKLMAIDSTRQEFVSNVSHELKTPITSMKVLADSLIQNENADLDMYKEFMTDIADEIDRESKIINDLLTLVKTDKSSAAMNIEEVDINSLLEIILKRVIPIANSRGIEITYESYRDVTADVDEVKLSLALTNIIENAVKYNVDNGWVKVTLNADHKNFHIKVADSGVGIPDDCKEKVFERFYRVDKARSRDTGGTGLGLAITRNVILMHKGTIKLYSESGEGTTFTIKIPIKYVEN